MGKCRGIFNNRAVFRRQGLVGLDVDMQIDIRTGFPPARVGVERGNFVKAEPFIVIGTDPLGRIDRAFFKG